jgi:hypothetical protein
MVVLIHEPTNFPHASLEACQATILSSLAETYDMKKDVDPWTWQA